MDYRVSAAASSAVASASASARRAAAIRAGRCLLAAGLALLLLTTGRPAAAANYTITVDASKQTAGNPRFWSASIGTGVGIISLRADWQTHAKIANRELGIQRVRGHGALSDDKDSMAILKWSGSGAPHTTGRISTNTWTPSLRRICAL